MELLTIKIKFINIIMKQELEYSKMITHSKPKKEPVSTINCHTFPPDSAAILRVDDIKAKPEIIPPW